MCGLVFELVKIVSVVNNARDYTAWLLSADWNVKQIAQCAHGVCALQNSICHIYYVLKHQALPLLQRDPRDKANNYCPSERPDRVRAEYLPELAG